MVAKSVIDIDINDAKFKEFSRMFEKYQKALHKMPGEWGKVNKSVSTLQGNFNKIQHALDTIAGRLDKNYVTLKNTNDMSSKVAKNFDSMGKSAKLISTGIASTTFNLLKLGSATIALGLLGAAGGLFGLSSLASSASSSRTQSQGLGVTSGELKAAKVNFGRYGDAEGLLTGLSGAQNDLSKQWAFQGAGLNPNQSAAQLLPQVLRKAAEVYKNGDAATAGQRLDVSGLSQLGVTVTQARQYASLKKEEMDLAEKHFAQDQKSLNLNDNLLRKWQDLDTQLDRASTSISGAFITGLQGLAKPVEELSSVFADAVANLLKSPKIGVWLTQLGNGIKTFADYLSGPEVEKDVNSFLSAISRIGQAIVSLADAINWILGNGQNVHGADNTVFSSATQKNMGNSLFHPNLGAIGAGQEEALRYRQDPKTGLWYSKEGILVSSPSAGAFKKTGLVPFSQVPKYNPNEAHTDLYAKIQGKVNSEKVVNAGNTGAGGAINGSGKGPAPWNPTSISLNVKTTKIPGMDTDINMLNAGGYYTGLRTN